MSMTVLKHFANAKQALQTNDGIMPATEKNCISKLPLVDSAELRKSAEKKVRLARVNREKSLLCAPEELL